MQKGKGLLTALAALNLVLVLANILLTVGNQSLQSEVSERQQLISQAIQLENLNQQVIAVLANMAVKSKDEKLKDLLVSSGVGFSPSTEPAPSKSPEAAPSKSPEPAPSKK
jgi:hypothetical protein